MKEIVQNEKDEAMAYYCSQNAEVPEDYLPEKSGKQLPDEGGWIQIIFPPFAEIKVECLSVYYALPVYKAESWNLIHKYEKRYLVKIATANGELRVYPHEYNVIKKETVLDYVNMTADNHVVINWLNPSADDFSADKLFYIMSKGIRRADAFSMLIGEITSQHVCWLTLHKEYQKMFAGVGVPRLGARQAVLAYIDSYFREIEEKERADTLALLEKAREVLENGKNIS